MVDRLPIGRRARHYVLRRSPLARTFAAHPAPRSPGRTLAEIGVALVWGSLCHAVFAVAVLAMIAAMWFGMSRSFGSVAQPWAWLANLALLVQFPIVHSLFLTSTGRRLLGRLGPAGMGGTLSTTTYAIIASVQLLALFTLWTPSGVIWWRAEGLGLWGMTVLYASAWLLLIKASWDAGPEVQSGALGWVSLLRGVKPVFPPMPVTGLFRLIRQPIYVSFALTTWTVPTWTPDQLLVASVLTAYCLIGPLAKERRFARAFGAEWARYRRGTPYWLPSIKGATAGRHAPSAPPEPRSNRSNPVPRS